MRFLVSIMGICCAVIMGVAPVYAQQESAIQYEIVVLLDIPQASGVTWSPDGSRLAVTAFPTIQIWDTESWELLQTISDAPAYSTKWSPDGNMIAGVCGGTSESVLIWDPTTGELLREMSRPRPADAEEGISILHNLAWSPDGTKIATDSGLWTDILLIWDLASDDNPQSLVGVTSETSASEYMDIAELEWSQNGQWLLTSGSDGNFRSRSIVRLYDAVTGEAMMTIFPGFSPIWGVGDEQFAGLSINDGVYVINFWNTETGELLSSFEAHEDAGVYFTWNFGENVIAAVRAGDLETPQPLIIGDVETGMRYHIDDVQTTYATDIEWQPNGNQLAISGFDAGVVILNFEFDD